ncbi:YjcZ family sporulation protein [Paenibacillus sp.]|jgi:hypothetical protein|nr:YjcZ family sporulation protein [Paenibacillus sp.]MDR0269171.1 YjcZ family sporulation protein [Paenibacillus sp.]
MGGAVGGVGAGYCNPFSNTGAILVLFILLVIILSAFCL